MHLKRDVFFSNKKTLVQFVLSLLVFFIHFRVFSAFKSASVLSDFFGILLTTTHVAVPLFFAISGALFFRGFRLQQTLSKWKSRVSSLCIPYLVWNSLWLILALLGNYTPLGVFLGGVKADLSLENVLIGVFRYGYFEPFWFIYQLIILTVMCPFIYLLIKNKWVGLATIAGFYLSYALGFRLPTVLFPQPDKVVYYLAGAWVGMHCFGSFASRKSKTQALFAFGIYIACCVFQGIQNYLPEWFTAMQPTLPVTMISMFAFWVSFDFLDIKNCPTFMKDSFLIYAMHSFVGAALAKILSIFLPKGDLFIVVNALITFPTTILVICIFGYLLARFCPKLKQLLTGRS